MLTEDYRVRLDQFEGPLDLLLFLIRKNEIEVTDIPISVLATQYAEFLSHIDRVDIDVAGEFLVMAATLTEIKSRMLMPRPESASGDAGAEVPPEDPRAELVRQLLAYKQYRDAARALEGRLEEWGSRYPGAAAGLPAGAEAATTDDAAIDAGDLELVDLTEAFRRVLETVNFDRLGEHKVVYEDTPIELHAADILEFIRSKSGSIVGPNDGVANGSSNGADPAEGVEFTSMFVGRTKPQMIGLFLALLDLVRRRRVVVRQDRIHGSIYLALGEGDDASTGTS